MELMDLSNVHFIQAIKDGSVVKVLNVNSFGRPAIKVKSIKAIYRSKEVRNIGSKPLLQQQEAVLTDSPFSCEIVERSSFPMDGITVKSEPETWDVNEGDVYSNQRAMEDDSSPDMTLRELRSRCRAKRMKIPKANDLPKKKMKSCASPDSISSKQIYVGVQPREDECDLDESLISLKKKLSKKSKAKRKFCTRDLVPISVKIEHLEPDDNLIGVAKHISSPGEESVEPDGGELETGESSDLTEESGSCVGNEVPCECLEIEPLFLPLNENESVEEIIEMDISLSEEYRSYVFNEVLCEYLELDEPLPLPVCEDEIAETNMEVDSLPATGYKSIPSFLCEPMKEDSIAHSPPQANFVTDYMPLSCLVCEPTKEGNIADPSPQAISVNDYESLPFPIDEHVKEDNISHSPLHAILDTDVESLPSVVCEPIKEGNIAHSPPLCSAAEAILVTENPDSEIYRSCKDFSCSQEIPCLTVSNTVTQMSKVSINDNLECVQQNSGDDECDSEMVAEGNSKKDTYPNLEDHVPKNSGSLYISSQNSSPCFNPNAASDSVDDDSPTTEKYPSLINEGTVSSVIGEGDCSFGTPPDAINRLTVMDAFVNDRSPHIQCPPKRLFSTRKVISPCSQEKLSHAMDEDELYDHIKRSRLGLEGAKIIFSPERSVKRRKTGSLQSVRKGILKSPNVSCVPRSVTECVSIHTCAQKAVEFSQRQMRDIEGLAVKLVRELRTMKDIVEETLLTEAQSSTQSKVTLDKMRIATENAVEAEDTTRKWLSMMGKDCNRFCKIMRSMEKKVAAAAAAASGNDVSKERKKITFADEAGGVLCHFKLIEDRSASESQKVDQNLYLT